MRLPLQAFTARRTQAGLTLIEFMISIVLGMVIVAAMAMLIGNQSVARSEVDRSGRLIENGRYAITTIVEDLQMAGYWGEIYTNPDAPTSLTTVASLPNPCSATVNSPENAASMGVTEGTFLYLQAYDGSSYTAGDLSCVTNWKPGTDIVVVRRADPSAVALGSLDRRPNVPSDGSGQRQRDDVQLFAGARGVRGQRHDVQSGDAGGRARADPAVGRPHLLRRELRRMLQRQRGHDSDAQACGTGRGVGGAVIDSQPSAR